MTFSSYKITSTKPANTNLIEKQVRLLKNIKQIELRSKYPTFMTMKVSKK